MSTPTVNIPGYVVGTWDIDPIHSDVSITARHLVVSKVRGRFDDFEGTIDTAENPLDSKVNATIKATSINTKQPQRDDHIRSADFLDVENHPTITFVSTGLRVVGDDFELDGNLTLHGVTKPVTLKLEIIGFGPGSHGEHPRRLRGHDLGQPQGLRHPLQRHHRGHRRRHRQRQARGPPGDRGRPARRLIVSSAMG